MSRRVTVLAGGTGSVKLVRGLSRIAGIDLTVISNVGDNIWLHGLYICPDIDTVLYGLAYMLDSERGWGIKSDTFKWLEGMKRLGMPAWFALGDSDLATHAARTELLKQGLTLTQATEILRKKLSITAKILPATDQHTPTIIETPAEAMHLQEFWVKCRGRPSVKSVRFEGVEHASPTKPVLRAITESERIVIAPGNPVSSIGPMVAIPQLRSALQKRRGYTIAVSPFIGARPLSGPAAKYMKAAGINPSPAGVAEYYSDFACCIAVSPADIRFANQIRKLGMEPLLTDILMNSQEKERSLALKLLSTEHLIAS